jgi:hypothetical protein
MLGDSENDRDNYGEPCEQGNEVAELENIVAKYYYFGRQN